MPSWKTGLTSNDGSLAGAADGRLVEAVVLSPYGEAAFEDRRVTSGWISETRRRRDRNRAVAAVAQGLLVTRQRHLLKKLKTNY